MDFAPQERTLHSSPPLQPPVLARQRSNSAEIYRRESISSAQLRDAVAFSNEAESQQPGIGRQRSNSLDSFKNSNSTLPQRARTAGGGEITPRAARLETLEWEEIGNRGSGMERGENECIRVAARFRPLSELEMKEGSPELCVEFGDDGKSCTIAVERRALSFYYDYMFQPAATQADVYQAVASPIVDGVINGFNGAILAYGQTGSGKTHTMLGPAGAEAFQGEVGLDDMEQFGVIPRALQSLLDYAAPTEGQVQLRASYVEIYNEHIIDLLSPVRGGSFAMSHERQPSASLRERAEDLYLPDVTETPVGSLNEAMEVMRLGNRNRHMAETQMNRHSSRSHAVFIVTVTNSIDKARQKFAQLYLVDLAGSERIKKTGVTGQRMEEAKQINKSLLALGQVIWSLAHKQKHIPYRDSKLTMLLRNCLGGNARTAVMIAASPHLWNIGESVSALRFGARASLVQNAAHVNVAEDPKELKRLLQRAREDLNELRSHCRKLQAEVAAFTAVETMPSVELGGVGFTNSTAVASGGDAASHALTSKRLLVWGLLPSLICPLNRAIMREPVVAADGWTYERVAIEKHFARAGRSMPISPVSGQRMGSRHLVPSHTIKQLVRQHLPDLAPPEVRLPVIVLLPVWLVMDLLSYLDAKSLGRSESAWTSFSAAISASRAWSKALARDYPLRAPTLQRGSSTGSTDSGPSARAVYSQLKIEEGRATRIEILAAPPSKGLKLVKPPTV